MTGGTTVRTDRLIAVLAECGRRGIALSANGDNLHFVAPKGLPPGLRAALVEQKDDLLGLLSCPWPPRPKILADWPIARRERWGRQANQLEDLGLGWREAEKLAFYEESCREAPSASPQPAKGRPAA